MSLDGSADVEVRVNKLDADSDFVAVEPELSPVVVTPSPVLVSVPSAAPPEDVAEAEESSVAVAELVAAAETEPEASVASELDAVDSGDSSVEVAVVSASLEISRADASFPVDPLTAVEDGPSVLSAAVEDGSSAAVDDASSAVVDSIGVKASELASTWLEVSTSASDVTAASGPEAVVDGDVVAFPSQ